MAGHVLERGRPVRGAGMPSSRFGGIDFLAPSPWTLGLSAGSRRGRWMAAPTGTGRTPTIQATAVPTSPRPMGAAMGGRAACPRIDPGPFQAH